MIYIPPTSTVNMYTMLSSFIVVFLRVIIEATPFLVFGVIVATVV
jgi:hypothetical protein